MTNYECRQINENTFAHPIPIGREGLIPLIKALPELKNCPHWKSPVYDIALDASSLAFSQGFNGELSDLYIMRVLN